MFELIVLGIGIYLIVKTKSGDGSAPPPTGGGPLIKKKGIIFPDDTMIETLDKGLNIKSYRNAQYLTFGDPHYYEASLREAHKSINSLEGVYNNYVEVINKKQNMLDHVLKRGRISFGYPDRSSNQNGMLPWFIVPFFPPRENTPLNTKPNSMFSY